MRKSFYSFDIFDTCLSRACGDPINVFTILSKKVLGIDATLSQIADFRYIRIAGELRARRNSKEEDVTLDVIYEECDFTALSTLSKNEIKTLELEVEKSLLRPIYNSYHLISRLHSIGHNIAFISDMYLPSSFLIEVLKSFDFWKDGDKLYVSGELGKCKSTGSLFEHVLNEENISRWSWRHYGDNLYSDFINPIKLGIRASLLRKDITFFQKLYIENDYNPVTNTFNIVSGICNSICRENESDVRIKFASDLIAPIYVPFVYHVLLDAKRRNIEKLYFLARDGLIFYKIAQVFSSLFPDISVNYLHVSRKSLYLPSLNAIDRDTIKKILPNKLDKEHIRELLDYFQIAFDDDFIQKCVKTNTDFVDYLFSREEYVSLIEEKRVEQKDKCLKYFIQEGLADNNRKSAIVDLRGTRKCQRSINSILALAGYNSIFAYYLEANYNRINPKSKDDYDAIVFGDFFDRNLSYRGLDIAFILLEHYFSITPHKRTSGYIEEEDGRIYAIFDKLQKVNSESEKICDINIQVCQSFAMKLITTYTYEESIAILNFSLRNLSKFMQMPNREYLKALLNVSVSESQFANKPIIKYFSFRDIFSKNIMWYDGSIMLVFGTPIYLLFTKFIKKCYRTILRFF